MQYMTLSGWIQFLVFLVALAAITKPMGIYLLRVLDPDKEGGLGLLEKILGPVERLVYKVARVNPKKQQNWKQYALSLLMLGMVTTVLSYGLYRIQDILPLKANMPSLGATVDKNGVINGGGKVPGIIAFIQAVSFSTNTDWQSYEPEQMFTHFSQIVATVLHFFFSSAVGIAAAAALVRGVARQQTRNIGNFWVDLTRITLYLFIPVCLVFALLNVWQGMPMNYRPYTQATTLDQSAAAAPDKPTRAADRAGPDGRLRGAQGARPERSGHHRAPTAPTPSRTPRRCREFLQLLLFFSVVAGLPYYYGRMINHRLHGWNIWLIMFAMLIVTNLITWYFEAQPNPRMTALGVSPANCNMEGKEVRIGIYNSATWANNVTITAEGANNCQHDSMMPMAGFMLMFNMHMGEVIFGGIGTGLYSMLVFIFVSVFLAGLMIGRTPDYLGKKIDSFRREVLLPAVADDRAGYRRVHGLVVPDRLGHGEQRQQRAACLQRIVLRLQFRDRQQRHRLRRRGLRADRHVPRPGRQHQDDHGLRQHHVQLDADVLHADRPLFRDHPRAGAGGGPGQEEGRAPCTRAVSRWSGRRSACWWPAVIIILGALNFLPGLVMGPVIEHFKMVGSHILY